MNLMSDYTYQHNIFFQYTFGSTAFLFYLTKKNQAAEKLLTSSDIEKAQSIRLMLFRNPLVSL